MKPPTWENPIGGPRTRIQAALEALYLEAPVLTLEAGRNGGLYVRRLGNPPPLRLVVKANQKEIVAIFGGRPF